MWDWASEKERNLLPVLRIGFAANRRSFAGHAPRRHDASNLGGSSDESGWLQTDSAKARPGTLCLSSLLPDSDPAQAPSSSP